MNQHLNLNISDITSGDILRFEICVPSNQIPLSVEFGSIEMTQRFRIVVLQLDGGFTVFSSPSLTSDLVMETPSQFAART